MSRHSTLVRPALSLLVALTAAAAGCLGAPPSDESDGTRNDDLSASACAAAPSWAAGVSYATGAVVKYQGNVYQCLQGHTSQSDWTPSAVPALWQEATCAGGSSTTTSTTTTTTTSGTGTTTSATSSGGGSTCNYAAWQQGATYHTGDIVIYKGSPYIATHDNPGYDPTISTWFWSPYAGCSGGTGGSGGSGGASGSSTTTTTTSGGTTSTTSTTSSGGGTGGSPSGKLFVGYYQTWSDSWKANGADTVLAHLPGYVNVVNLAFAEPNMSYTPGSLSLGGTGIGLPYDGPTLKAAVTALHQAHPGTKVMVSVGGATFPSWSSFNAGAVAAFVKDFGLDGVDLDYEPANPACTSAGGHVSCPSDTEYVGVVNAMRAALPHPYWVSAAMWSVGAYGEGQWANEPPSSAYAGIALAVLEQAGPALDLVNVMSYDASPAFSSEHALAAYQHYYAGRIAMGIEVPPEAWGGHVETVSEIDTLADAVNGSGAAGLMLWSIQKPGPAQQFATEMCTKLGLGSCSTSML